MKKLLVAIAALGLVSIPAAATAKLGKITKPSFGEKGTLTIGATLAGGGAAAVGGAVLSFNNINPDDDNDDNDTSGFGIAPNIGYFVIPNLEISVGLAYASNSVGDADASAFAFAPAVRYYLSNLKNKGVFPYFGLGFAYLQQTVPGQDKDLDITGSDITIGAGLTQALGGRQGATIAIGLEYHVGKTKADIDGAKEENFGGLMLGVRFGAYLN
jgi:hypothetical protein